jgi:hypothetical protein
MLLLQDHLPDSFSPATFSFYLLLASATRTFCVELSAILMEVNMMYKARCRVRTPARREPAHYIITYMDNCKVRMWRKVWAR